MFVAIISFDVGIDYVGGAEGVGKGMLCISEKVKEEKEAEQNIPKMKSRC